MLKKAFIKKICIALFCLLVILLLYLFPQVKNNGTKEESSYTVKDLDNVVYLIDKNNNISRVPISLRNDDIEEKVKELISLMSIDSIYSNLIPNGFRPLLPKGTSLISSELKDGNLKINLSKELLNIKKDEEERVIEALIYTFTSLDDVKSITIFVEGKILTRLPNSGELIPNPLDRSYGINKKYKIDSIKGTTKTTIYYLSKVDDFYYYIPVTKVSNEKKEKIEVIISELKSNNVYDTSLMSYLNSEATLKKYDLLDKEMDLEFNTAILSGIKDDKLLEEVTYAINLSIKDAYTDVNKVVYYVNDEKIADFNLKGLE